MPRVFGVRRTRLVERARVRRLEGPALGRESMTMAAQWRVEVLLPPAGWQLREAPYLRWDERRVGRVMYVDARVDRMQAVWFQCDGGPAKSKSRAQENEHLCTHRVRIGRRCWGHGRLMRGSQRNLVQRMMGWSAISGSRPRLRHSWSGDRRDSLAGGRCWLLGGELGGGLRGLAAMLNL